MQLLPRLIMLENFFDKVFRPSAFLSKIAFVVAIIILGQWRVFASEETSTEQKVDTEASSSANDELAEEKTENKAIPYIRALNEKALEAYDVLKYLRAKKLLIASLNLARRESITSGKELVDTYMHMGMLYGAGLKNPQMSEEYFRVALSLDPSVKLDEVRATPEVKKLFLAAGENPSSSGTQESDVDTDDAVNTVGDTDPGEGGEYRPGSNGNGDDETYDADMEGGEDIDGPKKMPRRAPGFAIGLLAGTGLGIPIGGKSLGIHPLPPPNTGGRSVDIGSGFAISPFFLGLQILVPIASKYQLSLEGRFQPSSFTSGANSDSGRAFAAFVMLRHWFKPIWGVSSYLGGGLGIGRIKHRVGLGDYDDDSATPNNIVDATSSGVGAVAGVAGVDYPIVSSLALFSEIVPTILFTNYSISTDLRIGLRYAF